MHEQPSRPPRSLLDLAVLVAAALTAGACLGPWTRVRSAALFGETGEVSAYLTPPGLMTMLAAALTAMIVGLARNAARTRETVNALSTALLVPAVAAGGTILVRLFSGPGEYRAAPMVWTSWFWAGLAAALVMSTLAVARWRAFRTR